MKKRFQTSIRILALLVGCLAVLTMLSYRKAIKVDGDVLKPCLSPSKSYKRSIQFGVLNPFVALFPHWTISYFETPTDIDYETPSITVDSFGQVDCTSKEVASALVEKGYRDSN